MDAQTGGDALVVDRRAQATAKARLRQRVLQRHRQRCAHADDEQPVMTHSENPVAAADFGAPAQPVGQLDDLLGRAEKIVGSCHGHEGQPDREEHLIQMRLGVHRPVQRALQQGAQRSREQESQRQAPQKCHVQALHQNDCQVAAGHGKSTMRQVDEIHQPHGHSQANGQHEQQHAVGHTVKQDSQHGGCRNGPRGANYALVYLALPGSLTSWMVSNSML